jgi:DeoD family purine-nucleoside phosphorylase
MPIHIRAEPATTRTPSSSRRALRARQISDTYLGTRSGTRSAAFGFTGMFEGKPASRGTGRPGATIVFEELIQLGAIDSVGTCGGLQPDHELGDLIVAISAVPADSTATHLVGNEPHCPTASWSLVHEAVHIAKHSDEHLHVGPVASSDLFYNPDEGQYERWSKRGVLGVEMEAAALFTLGAIRGVEAGCLLTVSDMIVGGEFKRISDEDLRAAVDRMTRLALAVAISD